MTRRVKLKQYAESIEPGVVVVEPWVLRRIIRLDGRVQGFRQLLSRRETYPIERNRLLGLVDSRELELTSPGSMPERLVVLAEPVEWDAADAGSSESHVNRLARPLFHACVHLEVAERFARDPAAHRVMAERRRQLGETVFAEIHAVLVQGDRLFPGSSDIDVYVEFVASYVEMRYFAPQTLSCYFPGVRDWQAVNTIIRQDIDYEAVFERLPIRGEDDARGHDESRGEIKSAASDGTITLAEFRQLQMKAEFASIAGNHVQAALLHASASIHGPERHSDEARAAACGELTKLAMRLRVPLRLSVEEAGDWARSLPALLVPSSDRLTSVEARLLYDIQKACVEHERRVHRTSLWRWILTRGKRPCVHPLPLLRHALTQRHLRRALRRLSATSLDAASRQHLTDLFARALSVVETRSRHRLRRIIGDVFDEFGVHPENVPERVAREKIIEELIDRILERSHVTMADLRDALSKNDLKLPDVAGLGGFLRGDRLLKVDRACSDTLEGVYRRGAVYQRWPQMLSSLAFGTRTGRFLTRFVAVPYGGAYLTLEFLGHLGRYFGLHGRSADALAPPSSTPPTEPVTLDWLFVAAVVCLGTWASLLVHRPAFLHWNMSLLRMCGRGLRKWFVDFPVNVVRSKAVQSILASYAFRVFENYAFRPVLTTALLVLVGRAIGLQLSHRAWFEIALVAALFLNSALGRFVDEVTMQFLMRVWRDLRIHVIGSLAHWTMEVFQGLETALERMINFIDDWLRLRRGSRRATRTFKMLGGVLWFVVAYVVTFVFTLLVEPQINPIKHFPVVTVAHKLILPTWPLIVDQLSDVLGRPLANTLVGTTIWLVPGVFGFLVWELKENWRLYRANRPRNIRAEPLGSHGETMLRLLRPAFHSGTLPKAFSALRRAVQRGESSEGKRFRRKWATIHRVELDVQRFVERELLSLLADRRFLAGAAIGVRSVHASTNRIDVALTCGMWPDRPAGLSWEYLAGRLVGRVSPTGWVNYLEPADCATLGAAVSGLFQRAGVAEPSGPVPLTVLPPFTWLNWVHLWQSRVTGAQA